MSSDLLFLLHAFSARYFENAECSSLSYPLHMDIGGHVGYYVADGPKDAAYAVLTYLLSVERQSLADADATSLRVIECIECVNEYVSSIDGIRLFCATSCDDVDGSPTALGGMWLVIALLCGLLVREQVAIRKNITSSDEIILKYLTK